MIGAALLLVLMVPAEDKPAPKFPLGKETTYVTGPLDKDGYIDYEAALNDRLGKGITPETNANVLLWKAFGPKPEGTDVPDEFFKRLGMDRPPEKGDYFIGMAKYLREHVKLEPAEFNAALEQQGRIMQRPWAAKDAPELAAWLKVNDKPLALITEATRRPDYYNPLVSRKNNKDQASLIAVLVPSVQKCREATYALVMRAMLRTGEGRFDEAWQDLLTGHRLGRLVGRGGTLIEALVGIAIDAVAGNADLVYLDKAALTAKQARACLKDLQGLPPMPPVANNVDLGERFVYLDYVQLIRRTGLNSLELLAGGPPPKKADPIDKKALAAINWEPALRNGNKWYDRQAAAMRLKDRAKRQQEFDRIEADLKKLKKDAVDRVDLLNDIREGKNGKETGKVLSDIMIGLLLPATRKVQNAFDRGEQLQRNRHLAFALAAYRSDEGRYPAKLDDLAPKYLAAIPDDLFSGKALVYRTEEKGYLLYSVGINGKDEGGRWMDDDPPGDDLRVRMPVPPLKAKP